MNASEGLWRQWSAQLRAFLPEIHGHRSKTLAFCVLGVVLAGTTLLPKVAEALVGISAANTPSIERRLSRFLANPQVAVVPVWTQLLGQSLRCWRERRLVFVLDATSVGDRATVLYLGLLVHSRLLPVSWQVLPVHEKWEQRQWDVVGALLDRVIPFLGAADCTLLADRGLVGRPLVQLCQERGWQYVFRLSAGHTCQPSRGHGAPTWIPCGRIVPQRGRRWYGSVQLWQEHPLAAQVSASLRAGPARALDRALRPTRGTPAHPRVRTKHSRRIHLPGPETSRLGSGRDRARRPRASGSVAPGGLSQPL